jgi:hypothetical protein
MFAQARNTLARAKLMYNKKTELYKIVVAFNVHTKQNDNGDTVHVFPTQAKCDYVSGDIVYKTLQKDRERIMQLVKQQLRTDNIEFV